MKVLNVMFTTRLGGLEQAFSDYNDALNLTGIEVIPIIHSKSPLTLLNVDKFYKVSNFSKHDPTAILRLYQLVYKEQPDFIITHGNRAHYMMKKVAGKIPVIGVLHTFSFDYIVDCDYVISVSQSMRVQLISLGYPKERSFYVPNMIRIADDVKYTPCAPASIPVIGVMTRIVEAKAIDVFVKALGVLKKKNIKFEAKIAGVGNEYDNIKKLIVDLSLESNIEMLGWIENKDDFYNKIDILCLPSREEPFGIVILEGFLNSKPLIVSNVSGPMEIVENNKDALVFENEDYNELAKLLEKLINSKELLGSLSKNGFNKVKLYDINLVSEKISLLLKELYAKKTL